ncbi:MAG: Holliday junction resolvase RuvX [Clostridia bacterium]
MSMKRVMAFDIGDKRIGIAVSDPLGITAQGIETYSRNGDLDQDIDYLIALADQYRPVRLVFGMPRNMNGSYGMQAEITKTFVEELLKKWDGEYDYYDERLTTMSAQRVLLEADMRRDKRKNVVDKIAAVIILQSYMGSHPQ